MHLRDSYGRKMKLGNKKVVRSQWFSKAGNMKFKNMYHHSYNEI